MHCHLEVPGPLAQLHRDVAEAGLPGVLKAVGVAVLPHLIADGRPCGDDECVTGDKP